MSDDPFMNIDGSVDSPPLNSPEEEVNSFSPSSGYKGKVIERKVWTVTTFRIYPNGTMFVVKSQSWFDKHQAEVKKKKAKPKVDVKKAKLTKEEVY